MSGPKRYPPPRVVAPPSVSPLGAPQSTRLSYGPPGPRSWHDITERPSPPERSYRDYNDGVYISPSCMREGYHEAMTTVDRGRPYSLYDNAQSIHATPRRPPFPGAFAPSVSERNAYYDSSYVVSTVDQNVERRPNPFGHEASDYESRLWTPSFPDRVSAPQAVSETRWSPLSYRQQQTTSYRPKLATARTSPANLPGISQPHGDNHISARSFSPSNYSVHNRSPMQIPFMNATMPHERPKSNPAAALDGSHNFQVSKLRNSYDARPRAENLASIARAESFASPQSVTFERSISQSVVSENYMKRTSMDGPLPISDGRTTPLTSSSLQSAMFHAETQNTSPPAADSRDNLEAAPSFSKEGNETRLETLEKDLEIQPQTELSAMTASGPEKAIALESTQYSQLDMNNYHEEDTLTRTDVLEQMRDVRKQMDNIDNRIALINRQREEMLILLENTKAKPFSADSSKEKLKMTKNKINRTNRRIATESRDKGLVKYYNFFDVVDSCLIENKTKGPYVQKRLSIKKRTHFDRTEELRQTYTTLHSAWLADCLVLEELAPKLPSASQNKVDLELHDLARNDFAKSEADLETVIERSKVEHAMDPAVRAKPNAAKLPPMEASSARFIDNNLQVTEDFEEIYGMKRVDDWNADEHELFCELFAKNPKQFGKISEGIEGRDRIDCLYHYYATKRDTGYKEMLRRADRRGKTGRKKKTFLSKGKGLLRELARDKEEAEEEAEDDIYEGRPPKRSAAPTTFSEERQRKVSEDETSNKKPRIQHQKNRRKKDTGDATITIESEIPPIIDKEEDAATTLARFGNTTVPEESLPPSAQFINASRPTTTSSYWSAKETQMFPSLLKEFGTAWHLIGTRYGTKSTMMVRNYYQRLSDRHPEYVAIAEKADAKRAAVRHSKPVSFPTSELQGPAMALFTDHGRMRPALPASGAPPQLPSPESWQSNTSSLSSSNVTLARTTVPPMPRTFNISSLLNTEPDTSDKQIPWFQDKPDFIMQKGESKDPVPSKRSDSRDDNYTKPESPRNLLSSLLNPLSYGYESNERGA